MVGRLNVLWLNDSPPNEGSDMRARASYDGSGAFLNLVHGARSQRRAGPRVWPVKKVMAGDSARSLSEEVIKCHVMQLSACLAQRGAGEQVLNSAAVRFRSAPDLNGRHTVELCTAAFPAIG